jgi:ATP/maltotriose-dependent transcriptional regulator MalT
MFEADDKVRVICIYCNYKEQKEQTVSNLAASLLKQMVQDSCATSENVKSLYTRHKNRNTRPTLAEFSRLLGLEIRSYSRVFIVVDALDECCEEDGTRAKLLRLLRSLPANVNLMVTSRNLTSIARDFGGTDRLDIRATDDDVRTYIESRLVLAPRRIKNLQEDIVREIVGNVDGM